MDVREFIGSIGKHAPAPVILFCPSKSLKAQSATFEPFLAERAVQLLTETYVDPGLKDLCYSCFFADETSAGEIVSVAETYPFISERRVIVVHAADKLQSESSGAPLLRYLQSPCETTLLILVAPQIDRRLKLYKACEKTALIVECAELKENEALQWAQAEVTKLGKKLDRAAALQLVHRSGTALSDVNNALTNVCNYLGATVTTVLEEHVLAACADVAEEQIWALTDAIAVSDTTKALRVLGQMYDLGKSEIEILGTLNWLIKTAYAVAIAQPGDPILTLFQYKKVAPLAKKFGLEMLRRAFALVVDTDFMLRSTGVDRGLALELMVIKLSAPAPKRQSA